MLERYFVFRSVVARLRASPLGRHLDGFAGYLAKRGYPKTTGARYIRHAEHLGRWMQFEGLGGEELSEDVLGSFAAHLGACRCLIAPDSRGVDGLQAFLEHLRDEGVASARPEPSRPPVLESFETWLIEQRGLREATVDLYLYYAGQFVAELGEDPGRYDAGGVRSFIVAKLGQGSLSAVRSGACAVRALLRHLVADGRCAAELVSAVPSVAGRQRTVPRYISAADVERVIAACDPATESGARDRAIVLLLARLGLRASDVMNLRLGDIDWSRGRLRLAGKGRRETHVPLPQDVGDALMHYLLEARPQVDNDHIFLRLYAPIGPLGGSSTVSNVVVRAVRRSGVDAPSPRAHMLRHSAATQMLRQGASLDAIGVILRHRSVETVPSRNGRAVSA